MPRVVKREPGAGRSPRTEPTERSGSEALGVTERRVLRSKYLAVKNLINDERDDLFKVVSDKFQSIISEVENLHQQVQKPREQVADAEALLDIANTLVTSVKSQENEGITPSDFVTSVLRNFGSQNGPLGSDSNSVSWKDIGVAVSHIFKVTWGCCTMLGPMNTEVKQRRVVVRKKHTGPIQSTRPEEVVDAGEVQTDTQKNIQIMFGILRRKRCVRLEHLVLNRESFAQTVENIFALSFLVKDGRVQMKVNDEGHHLITPRNSPTAAEIASGEVTYSHFVLKIGFSDWKLMASTVPVGEELMPRREYSDIYGCSQPGSSPASEVAANINSEACDNTQVAGRTTPIRKLTRNHGLVIQEQAIVEETPEKSSSSRKKSKRLFSRS